MERKIIVGSHLFTTEEKIHQFGYGPWIEEIDYQKWEYRGVICEANRNDFGCWCGYVQVPLGHPWYGKNYNDLSDVDVHGGLTFSEFGENKEFVIGFDCAHYRDLSPLSDKLFKQRVIEAKDKNDETSLRLKDLIKMKEKLGFLNSHNFLDPTYKNINFVQVECESLADQMLAVKEN